MEKPGIAILHYSAPPVIGGVEGVIEAHARQMALDGYPVTMIAGRGDQQAMPPGVQFIAIPLLHTQQKEILEAGRQLDAGLVPDSFTAIKDQIKSQLHPILQEIPNLIVHNVFTKHYNLPLTAALSELVEEGVVRNCIAWCHDLSWTSPNSKSKVHDGYPWELIQRCQAGITYVAISEVRKQEITTLKGCREDQVPVIYSGVDAERLLGLSPQGVELIDRLGLWQGDLNLLMPVRVTQAKNIEYAIQLAAALRDSGVVARIVLTGPPDPHEPASMDYYHSLLQLREETQVVQEFRFVYESGPASDQPLMIDQDMVGQLYRVCDFMFMPSHREGFGLPVLEAGLAGLPVISTDVPAATEIGQEDVLIFSLSSSPQYLAEQIILWIEENPVYQMRKKVRQNYTWQAVFRRGILPLLEPASANEHGN